MNVLWPRIFRTVYRKEPISSFVFTAAIVDAAIGGIHSSGVLLYVGLGAAGMAMALRWWLLSRPPTEPGERQPMRALPYGPARTQLPPLTLQKRKPSA